ncbi:MAG: hypothetical protein KBD65_00535 [Candidatus Moranbacteria bacterium]|nr:hypothetical protein [Candidatus Moranbacteria bacterium]
MDQAIIRYHRTFSSEDAVTAASAISGIRFLLKGYDLNREERYQWEIGRHDRVLEVFEVGGPEATPGSFVATLHYLQQQGVVSCVSVVLALDQDRIQGADMLLKEFGFLSGPLIPHQGACSDRLYAGFHDLISPSVDWFRIRLCIDPPSDARPAGGTAKQ